MLKIQKANYDRPECYVDEVNSRVYSRVVGGLAWPAKDCPGFLVVLARDLDADSSGNYHYWILAERENADIGTLIRVAMDMRKEFIVKTWVANVNNKPAMYFLGELMRSYDYKERLNLDMAPHADNPHGLSFYHPLIKEHMTGRKLLHFGNSSLPGYLTQVTVRDLSQPPDDFPAVAALGYALAELYGWELVVPVDTIDYTNRPGAWML